MNDSRMLYFCNVFGEMLLYDYPGQVLVNKLVQAQATSQSRLAPEILSLIFDILGSSFHRQS